MGPFAFARRRFANDLQTRVYDSAGLVGLVRFEGLKLRRYLEKVSQGLRCEAKGALNLNQVDLFFARMCSCVANLAYVVQCVPELRSNQTLVD